MSDKKRREYAISVAMLIVQSRNQEIRFDEVSSLALAIEGYINDGVVNKTFLSMAVSDNNKYSPKETVSDKEQNEKNK